MEALEHVALVIAVITAVTFHHTIQRLRQELSAAIDKNLDLQQQVARPRRRS